MQPLLQQVHWFPALLVPRINPPKCMYTEHTYVNYLGSLTLHYVPTDVYMLADLSLDLFIFWGWALKGVPLEWQNQSFLTWAEPKYYL